MMPHHFRMLMVVLAFPLAYLAGFGLYQAYLAYWHTPTIAAVNKTRIQYPNYHLVALDALSAFKALPRARQEALVNSLDANLVDFDAWIEAFAKNPPDVTCIGENHSDDTRLFLGASVFSKFKPDVLMIESTEEERRSLVTDTRAYAPLLGSDIQAVVSAQSETTQIIGIEQDKTQKTISREQALLENFLLHAKPDRSHAVLFGALHCGNYEGWFYDLLTRSPSSFSSTKTTSLRVLGEHQDGSLEAFIYFLDEIGLTKNHFTLTNTKNLDPWVYKSFPVFHDQTLKHYDAILVFRPQ